MSPLCKPLCLAASITLFVTLSSYGQCNSNLLPSITYDTSVAGTGNNSHVFSFSQFDPSVGTLVSVKINSSISVNYGFTLQNVEAVNRNFSVAVGRFDQYSSTALSSPVTNNIDTTIGNYPLGPGSSVTVAPYTILNRYNEVDSITTNTVNFLGGGNVVFNYLPITYTNLSGSNTYYYSATANDTINFSITYYYCTNSVLANDIISFTANNQNDGTVKLSWTSSNPQPGRNYEVQASTDSSQFNNLALVAGETNQSNYSYSYIIPPNATGRNYFRIKIMDASGAVSYSEIRSVLLSNTNSNQAYIYPNPSDSYINLVLNENGNMVWDIGIYSADGSLIQKNRVGNSSLIHIGFNSALSAGTYFIKAQNAITNKQHLLSFIVK